MPSIEATRTEPSIQEVAADLALKEVEFAAKEAAHELELAEKEPELASPLAEHSDGMEDTSPVAREFPAEVAALAILASSHMNGRASDIHDNEAEKQHDGSIRLSIKLKGGGHERLFVRVPATVTLLLHEKETE